MSRQLAFYQWICRRLQRDEPFSGQPSADLDSLRTVLKPCDVLLVAGHSNVDRTFKVIGDSRFARAVLYVGRLHDVADPAQRRNRLMRQRSGSHRQGIRVNSARAAQDWLPPAPIRLMA